MAVNLRPVEKRDLGILFNFQADPIAAEMAGYVSKDKEAHLAHWEKIMKNRECITRVIELDGNVVGWLASWMSETDREVAYWVDRRFWGQGIATKALMLFQTEIKVRPLHARIFKTNVASNRVLEKCGYSVTGHEEDEILFILT